MESSYSDDCLITNFVKAKNDKFFIIEEDKPLLKKFKREKQEGWKKKMKGKEEQGDLELAIVPGDGHCISHCFSKHFNQPLNEVLKCLKNEFISNLQHYEEFSDSLSKEEILQTVDQYIKSKKYNNGNTDLFVHAFSKAYRVNVVLIKVLNCKKGGITIICLNCEIKKTFTLTPMKFKGELLFINIINSLHIFYEHLKYICRKI